jgi:hypothetical protein
MWAMICRWVGAGLGDSRLSAIIVGEPAPTELWGCLIVLVILDLSLGGGGFRR